MEKIIKKYSELDKKLKLINNIDLKKKENIDERIKKIGITSESLYAFIDTTIFSSCKEGVGFTSDSLIKIEETFISMENKIKKIKYKDIITYNVIVNKKLEPEKFVVKYTKNKNEEVIEISNNDINSNILKNLLNEILEYGKENSFERDTIIILEDQPSIVKIMYIKSIIEAIGKNEGDILLKIYSVMNVLKFSAYERQKVKEFLFNLTPQEKSVKTIKEELDKIVVESKLTDLERKILQISLIKDLISIHLSDEKNPILSINRIKEFSDNEFMINEIIKVEKANRDLIKGKIDDTKAKEILKESSAKLSAVGVPMVALYFSGSVLGFSAAGITSALSALGLGGILGLSSMVTGIGVVILTGVVTYKAVSWITGGKDESDKREFRDMLIKEALLSNQKTSNMILEDTLYLTNQFIEVAEKFQESSLKCKKLLGYLKIYEQAVKNSVRESSDLDGYLKKES